MSQLIAYACQSTEGDRPSDRSVVSRQPPAAAEYRAMSSCPRCPQAYQNATKKSRGVATKSPSCLGQKTGAPGHRILYQEPSRLSMAMEQVRCEAWPISWRILVNPVCHRCGKPRCGAALEGPWRCSASVDGIGQGWGTSAEQVLAVTKTSEFEVIASAEAFSVLQPLSGSLNRQDHAGHQHGECRAKNGAWKGSWMNPPQPSSRFRVGFDRPVVSRAEHYRRGK